MTVIKNLAFCDKNKLKNLSSFVESELDLSAFYPFFIDFFHSFLPLRLKFLNESFEFIENKKITGLITVAKAGRKKIKITRLLLEENSIELFKLLVNYVTTLYAAKGAETFYVVIDKRNALLLNTFKNVLNFNKFAYENVYKLELSKHITKNSSFGFDHIRKIKSRGDIKKAVNLINNAMNSYQRVIFQKETGDITRKIKKPVEHYVLLNSKKNNFSGYFSILKLNDEDYLLDFVLDTGYAGYIEDIINFSMFKILKKKGAKNLLVRIKSYYSNFEEIKEILKVEYDNFTENEILTKNFLMAEKQQFSYERIIFNDITPAF